MPATTLADGIRFNATSTGTGDFVDASAVTGYRRGVGNLVDGNTYRYRAENASLSEYERGSGVWNNSTSTLARTTIEYSSTGSKIAFSSVPQVGVTPGPEDLGSLGDFAGMTNGTLVASAAAGALTVAVKTLTGADPSAGDPVYFFFRSATLTSGTYTRIKVTAALSLVLASGNTLGAVSANALIVWITVHNDAGTVRIGAINCTDASGVYCPNEGLTYTTATPGNSSKVLYTGTAIASAAPWRFLGRLEWTSLTTAGTWTSPTAIVMYGPGIKKPGDLVNSTNSAVTGGSIISTSMIAMGAAVNHVPQNGANFIDVDVTTGTTVNSASTDTQAYAQLRRSGTAVGNGWSTGQYGAGVSQFMNAGLHIAHFEKPGSLTSIAYQLFGNVSGTIATCTFTFGTIVYKIREYQG